MPPENHYPKRPKFDAYDKSNAIAEALGSWRGDKIMESGGLRSGGYVPNVSGFRIAANGDVEFNNGVFRGRFTIGGTVITIGPTDSIQDAIDTISAAGGGTLYLEAGTYALIADMLVPSFVAVIGAGLSTVIDGGGSYGIKSVGSTAYRTGTVAIAYRGQTVVGTGTTFTAAMIGQSILLEDFWYVITARTDNTHITIDRPYMGEALSAASYVVATTVNTVNLVNFLVQNTSGSCLKFQYANGINIDGVVTASGGIGIEGIDSSFFNILNAAADQCTKGMTFNNVQFGTYFNNNTTQCSGNGTEWTTCRNWCIETFTFVDIGGNGMAFTGCGSCDVLDFSVEQVGGIGIVFISNNQEIGVFAGIIKNCVSDGIKLTATSDHIKMGPTLDIRNNGGYGINIAAASCDKNLIMGNDIHDNTAGSATDSGTGTLIRSNLGLADN